MTMETHGEFAKRMEEKYPRMFTRPYGGMSIGPGWFKIIESLLSNIRRHTDWKKDCIPVTIIQIKEKFGGLRFYYSGGDDTVRGLVKMAESWASTACEECGEPGTLRSGGWVRTLCDKHEAEYQAK